MLRSLKGERRSLKGERRSADVIGNAVEGSEL